MWVAASSTQVCAQGTPQAGYCVSKELESGDVPKLVLGFLSHVPEETSSLDAAIVPMLS